jgi:hypothetical protein
MVAYHPSDTIPMSTFEFAWRITNAQWSSLPEKVLSRIKPLSPSKSTELLQKSPFEGTVDQLFDPGQYHVTRQVSLEGESNSEKQRVKKWFGELPVPANQEIYLCWQVGDGVAAVTDWATFIEVWDDLWYPFDRLCVFDETRQWAVLLGPEERAVFIETMLASRNDFDEPISRSCLAGEEPGRTRC